MILNSQNVINKYVCINLDKKFFILINLRIKKKKFKQSQKVAWRFFSRSNFF
jgi:hypothetical protein